MAAGVRPAAAAGYERACAGHARRAREGLAAPSITRPPGRRGRRAVAAVPAPGRRTRRPARLIKTDLYTAEIETSAVSRIAQPAPDATDLTKPYNALQRSAERSWRRRG
jgi:hypothetical protein